MQMQFVCRSAPAHLGPTRLGAGATVRRVAVTPSPRLRARAYSCVRAGGSGTTEPVPAAQSAQSVVREPQQAELAEVVAEELESLEEAAIAGEDEGRRPTDYDRRAHIFEESSRVFRELKQRCDGRGGGGAGAREPHRLG